MFIQWIGSQYQVVAAVPSLMLTYGSDTTLFGFTSTSQQFSMFTSSLKECDTQVR